MKRERLKRTFSLTNVEDERHNAEAKAWDALARYKFQMFGYWAAIWVHLNRLCMERQANPFRSLVTFARKRKPESPALAERRAHEIGVSTDSEGKHSSAVIESPTP